MNTYSSENQDRISKLAVQLRHKHDAMDWGIDIAKLIGLEGLSYQEYDLTDQSLLKRITKKAIEFGKKIKAALIVKEETVIVDENMHWAKKPFGKGHELGHHTIPEHKEIFYVCSEHDLSPETRAEMEYEANVFASEILFPKHLMTRIYADYALSMQTILFLREQSKASFYSAALKYVTLSPYECCLLVFDILKDSTSNTGIKLKTQVWSDAWHSKYRRKLFHDNQILPLNHNLATILSTGQDFFETMITLKSDKRTEFTAYTHYNSYNIFALIIPMSD